MQRRDATAREVAMVIERDPRLLSAVLKLGRSALYAGMFSVWCRRATRITISS